MRYEHSIDTSNSIISLVRKRHEAAFMLCDDVLAAVKPAISKPRRPSHAVPRALEILMHQAHNTLQSVYILSNRALTEDAATLARRLLEIAVTAGYITCENSPTERLNRAGCYLSLLWQETPDELCKTIPDNERRRWRAFVSRHQKRFHKNKPCRRPKFREMFESLKQDRTYEDDYSLLSSIAHGRPSSFIQIHSGKPVPMRDESQVSTMIVFSCRYYLVVADQWNRYFQLMPIKLLKPVIHRSVEFFINRSENDGTT